MPPGDLAFFTGEIDYRFACIIFILTTAWSMSSNLFVLDFRDIDFCIFGGIFFTVEFLRECMLGIAFSCACEEKHWLS